MYHISTPGLSSSRARANFGGMKRGVLAKPSSYRRVQALRRRLGQPPRGLAIGLVTNGEFRQRLELDHRILGQAKQRQNPMLRVLPLVVTRRRCYHEIHD